MECNAFENSGQNFLASYSRNKLNFPFLLMETKFSDDLQQAEQIYPCAILADKQIQTRIDKLITLHYDYKLKKEYDESA
jgi:hypothetical protein